MLSVNSMKDLIKPSIVNEILQLRLRMTGRSVLFYNLITIQQWFYAWIARRILPSPATREFFDATKGWLMWKTTTAPTMHCLCMADVPYSVAYSHDVVWPERVGDIWKEALPKANKTAAREPFRSAIYLYHQAPWEIRAARTCVKFLFGAIRSKK